MAADPDKGLLGQHAQDSRLAGCGHVGHFVQEQRAAVCHFEQPGADQLAVGFFAKQFLFKAFRGNSRRIDRDERLVDARAPTVQQARRDFLARSGRAGDQHAAAGMGDAFQCCAYGVDRRGIAGEFIGHPEIAAQAGIFPAQLLGFGRALDQQQQAFRFERLFDEIHRAAADRGNGGIDIAVAGKDHHRQFGFALFDLVQHFEPVHRAAVQPDIEQNEAGAPFVNGGERGHAVTGDAAGIAFVAQHARDEFADVAFIVDDQDIKGHWIKSFNA